VKGRFAGGGVKGGEGEKGVLGDGSRVLGRRGWGLSERREVGGGGLVEDTALLWSGSLWIGGISSYTDSVED